MALKLSNFIISKTVKVQSFLGVVKCHQFQCWRMFVKVDTLSVHQALLVLTNYPRYSKFPLWSGLCCCLVINCIFIRHLQISLKLFNGIISSTCNVCCRRRNKAFQFISWILILFQFLLFSESFSFTIFLSCFALFLLDFTRKFIQYKTDYISYCRGNNTTILLSLQ